MERSEGRNPLQIQDPTASPVYFASLVESSDDDSVSSGPCPSFYV